MLSLAQGDVTAVVLAMVLLLTFPGAPCIYYGDEIGMEGGRNRRRGPPSHGAIPSDWHSGILSSVRSLVALRHAHPALRHGSYRLLPTGRMPGSTGSSSTIQRSGLWLPSTPGTTRLR